MTTFDPVSALALLGKTFEAELHWDEDDEILLCHGQIVGVALTIEGERPYFLIRYPDEPGAFPDELLWQNIRSLKVID
ncbi:MAG: hypothetical protein GAK43_02272 [Stenotrophomonas maltophilia]|nr:MAG: hypothetical protein GAK43_02272 [Stenotrophomonas maltophilia]